jgi:hypothetical protein
VDPGNIVYASDTTGLVVITELQPITVVFTLPEDSLPAVLRRLHTGQTLPVEAYDGDQRSKLASGKLVVLPDHLYAVWTLRTGDDHPGRWRFIKRSFTRRVAEDGIDAPRNVKGECALWQRR